MTEDEVSIECGEAEIFHNKLTKLRKKIRQRVQCTFCKAKKKIPIGKIVPSGWVRGMTSKKYVCVKCKKLHQGETF